MENKMLTVMDIKTEEDHCLSNDYYHLLKKNGNFALNLQQDEFKSLENVLLQQRGTQRSHTVPTLESLKLRQTL